MTKNTSRSYASRRAASLALGPIDLRSGLRDAVRSQGPRPLCVPFSVSTAHEFTRAIARSAQLDHLAVEPLWRFALGEDLAGEQGTTLVATAEALKLIGQTTEQIWPYNQSLGSGTEVAPPEVSSASWQTAKLFRVPLLNDGVEHLIEDCLASGLPVVLVIEVTTEFEEADQSGEIAVPALSSAIGDYHAVTAIGVETNSDGTRRRLLICNSWGRGWGAGGYGWLPYDYLIAFGGEAGAIDPESLVARRNHALGTAMAKAGLVTEPLPRASVGT